MICSNSTTCTPDRHRRRRARTPLAVLVLLVLASSLAAAEARGPIAIARQALTRGDAIAAEISLKQALAQGASKREVAAPMGEALLLEGNLDEARDWLGPADFMPEDRQRGYHMLARLEGFDGDFDAAADAYEQALASGSPNAEIWVDFGRMRYASGAQHFALQASIEALRADSLNPRALEFRGQLVRDSRGLVASLPWFARGLEQAPDDIGLLGEYAATLGEVGRYADMLRVTRHMIELDGRNARAFYLQSVMAARAGKFPLARRLLNRTGSMFKGVPAAMLLNGILDLEGGNTALAEEDFAELERRQPDNGFVRNLFARALLENGEANEVVARFGPAANQPYADRYLLTVVGRAYEALDRRDLAANFLDRAARPQEGALFPLANGEAGQLALFRWGDDPYRLDAMVPTVRNLLAQDRAGEAAAIATRLADHYEGSVDVETLAGDVALARGDTQGALDNYTAAAEVRRTYQLVERMVAAHRMAGRVGDAYTLAEDYLSQHPQDGDAVILAARLAAQTGNWQRARDLLAYGDRLGAVAGNPSALALLVEADLQFGNAATALATAQAAYRLQRSNGQLALLLARALQANGRAGADALLAKARKMGIPGA